MPLSPALAVPAPSAVWGPRPLPASGRAVPPATLAMFLNSGGDERIRPDPVTGRTRYGTKAVPAEDEIWLASSTASCVNPQGFAAASDALARLIGPRGTYESLKDGEIKSWFDQLRRRLVALFGIPGAEAVLSASGTDTEFIALSAAQAVFARPITNIIAGGDEAGPGLTLAGAGRHFLASSCLGGAVAPGTPLEGFEGQPIETHAIAIRDASGYPRDAAEIDREAALLVAQALATGRDVVLHVLDASQTGLSGVTRETARALAAQAQGRMAIVVDASQLRCPPARLWDDLGAGFMVMISGSKFAGGPPFAGALLLPPAIVARLQGKARAPSGLAAYSARFDWPEVLRNTFAADLDQPINLGLGLRWEAALAAIEPYFALPEVLRMQVLTWFAGAVHRLVAARPHLRQLAGEPSRAKTIIPIATSGHAATPAGAAALHAALAAPEAPAHALHAPSRACHLGAPVAIGDKTALRLCASMPLVLDIAARIMEGQRIEAAVAPVVADLNVLFAKWDALAGA
ncbi:MAG: hypothetical protein ACYC5H_07235 [Methylovirgula sp.]